MMKILSIILIISIIQQCCFGFERIYVNFIPYSNSECSGTSYSGIGYSGAIDTCLTIDGINNFKFTISNEGQVTYSIFKSGQGGSITCDQDNLISESTESFGSCVSSNTLTGINSNYQPLSSFFYKVIVSPTTFIAPNSFVDTYLAGDCDDDMDIILADYITNGTMAKFAQTGNTYKYLCINSQPFMSMCKNGKCARPTSATLTCYNSNQFYNGSSFEQPCSSGSQTGDNSNSCVPAPFVSSSLGSGSGAVSSGAAATATSSSTSGSSGSSGSSGGSQSTSTSSSTSGASSNDIDITFFHNTFCYEL